MKETMVDAKVTYTLERGGKFFIVENVPARVCAEMGEQYFAPETVEHIQAIIKSRKMPDKEVGDILYSLCQALFLKKLIPVKSISYLHCLGKWRTSPVAIK